MYAVVGSTGHVGMATVRALLAAGKQVRALHRDEKKADSLAALGAEPFLASVEDGARLEMALQETEGVFVMTPPLMKSVHPRSEHKMMLAALKHAILASHTPKAVFLSSIGAQQEAGTGAILKTHDMEQEFLELKIDAAFIRAASFMENFVPLLPHARETGVLPSAWEPADKAIAMIACEDIGQLAAKLLVERWSGRRMIELEGPEEYSPNDVAAVLSEKFARPVTAQVVPKDERQGMYEKVGMTAGAAQDMAEMMDGFNNGQVRFEGGEGKERVKGTTSLKEMLGAL